MGRNRFGAAVRVQIVDYFILRRRQLHIGDLFLPISQSRYGYWKGVNFVAFIAVGGYDTRSARR
jgi:cytosine/uracil/thiamine/allantoin permease